VELGYAFSSEEHSPAHLVRHAPAPDERLEMLEEVVEVMRHQVGPDQSDFLYFAKTQLFPRF
jgi:hypothetical protein